MAKGVVYTEPIKTGWRPPRFLQRMSEEDRQFVRDKFKIIVEGNVRFFSICGYGGVTEVVKVGTRPRRGQAVYVRLVYNNSRR